MRLQDVKGQIKKISRGCVDVLLALIFALMGVYMVCVVIVFVPFLVVLTAVAAFAAFILRIGGGWANGISRVFSSKYGDLRVSMGGNEGKLWKCQYKWTKEPEETKERTSIEYWYQQNEGGGPLILMKRITKYIWVDEKKAWKQLSSVEATAEDEEENQEECQHQYTR